MSFAVVDGLLLEHLHFTLDLVPFFSDKAPLKTFVFLDGDELDIAKTLFERKDLLDLDLELLDDFYNLLFEVSFPLS